MLGCHTKHFPPPEHHEEDRWVPRKLFNLENFTPVEIEQLIIALGDTADQAHDRFRSDNNGYETTGVSDSALTHIHTCLIRDLEKLPEQDIERANDVFTHLGNSRHSWPRAEVAELIDRWAEHQVTDPDIRQWTTDMWVRMMDDKDEAIYVAAREAAARAIEAGQLPLEERQLLYRHLTPLWEDDLDEPM